MGTDYAAALDKLDKLAELKPVGTRGQPNRLAQVAAACVWGRTIDGVADELIELARAVVEEQRADVACDTVPSKGLRDANRDYDVAVRERQSAVKALIAALTKGGGLMARAGPMPDGDYEFEDDPPEEARCPRCGGWLEEWEWDR